MTVLINTASEVGGKIMFASNNEMTQEKTNDFGKMLISHNVAPRNEHNAIRVANLHLSTTF